MKIGILTEILDRTKEKTGVAYYTEYLIRHLLKLKGDNTVYLVHYKKDNNPIYQKTEEIKVPSSSLRTPFREIFSTFLRLPTVLKREKIDLLHIPSPTLLDSLPCFLSGFKKVLTFHDLFLFTPQCKIKSPYPYFKQWISQRLRRPLYFLIKNKVDKYIAVSNNTKKDLMKYLSVPEEKIEVIYLAPAKRFKKINAEIPDFIGSTFILTHHFSSGLLEIFYKLKKKGIRNKLVIFGGITKIDKDRVVKLIKDFNLEKEVILAGYVSSEALVKLYNTADLFVRLVGYEGFGLPPLEAMTCGCPVVVSNVASLPEVVGEAGVLVDPNRIDEWVEKIYYILTHEDFRQELIQKGLEQAKKFSWEKTAKETLETYHQVLQ